MKQIKLTSVFLVLCISMAFAQKEKSIDYSSLINEYRELIKTEMPKNNIVGMSIALTDKNGLIWAEGYGYENLTDSLKANANTLYGIGSITKLFTASAIMQLAEQHKLDIDKPVTLYVPEFKMKSLYGNIDGITTRNLLSHHSGFPSDLMGLNAETENYKNVVSYLNEQYTAFPPNYMRVYSNIGYCFLGYEIDKISGLDYPAYITNNIFKPLGMQNSIIRTEPASLKGSSKTYNQNKEQKDEPFMMNLPAGGIFSTVKDMSLFIQSWLLDESPILKKETIDQIFTAQNTDNVFHLGGEFGIGWELKKSKYNYRAEHGGATFYYRAQIAINRSAGLGVIILSNSATAGSFTWRAGEILDKACAIKGISEIAIKGFDAESIIKRKINLKEYQGNYGQNMGWYPLIAKDSALIGKPGNDSLAFKLKPDGYFGLAVKQGDAWNNVPSQQFIFTELGGEKVFMAQAWGDWVVASKKYPEQIINQTWKRRLGKYKIVNNNANSMFKDAELLVGENTIYISGKTPFSDQPVAMPLEIRNDNLASVLGTSTYSGSMLQVRNENGHENLYFMGVIMEKL